MSANLPKEVRISDPKKSDPFCRLRVPLYLLGYEALFHGFLVLHNRHVIPSLSSPCLRRSSWTTGCGLSPMMVGSCHRSAGAELTRARFCRASGRRLQLHHIDFWSIWDLGIIVTGTAFFVCRTVELHSDGAVLSDVFRDIRSEESLFLVPTRASSVRAYVCGYVQPLAISCA